MVEITTHMRTVFSAFGIAEDKDCEDYAFKRACTNSLKYYEELLDKAICDPDHKERSYTLNAKIGCLADVWALDYLNKLYKTELWEVKHDTQSNEKFHSLYVSWDLSKVTPEDPRWNKMPFSWREHITEKYLTK